MDKNKLYFTSDTHWGHKNIIKYSKRPYSSVPEMNEAMIRNWNDRVEPDATVYHVGDFAFMTEDEATAVAQRLNGNKILVLGNHDKSLRRYKPFTSCFARVSTYEELRVPEPGMNRDEQLIVICHYPMMSWNQSGRGSWMLHGHCHGNLKYPFIGGKIMDVGVDPNGMRPISYAEVKAKLDPRPVIALDHHGGSM